MSDAAATPTPVQPASTTPPWIWWVLIVLGAIGLAWRAGATEHGMAKVYVEAAPGATAPEAPVTYRASTARNPRAFVSVERTIGVWVGAILTLCVMSFLYRDNPGYKFAESLVVGVSAGYWLTNYIWDILVAKLAEPFTRIGQTLFTTAIEPDTANAIQRTPATIDDWLMLVPVLLGALVFTRWVPPVAWLSRWPLALTVGTFAGLRLVSVIEADFLRQVDATTLPWLAFVSTEPGAAWDAWRSLQHLLVLAGVICCLSYFLFSVQHRGLVGRVARVGIWFLMITFGASFAFTVMGRITLLTMRLEFLFDDWLWLIDPGGTRPW